MTARPAPAPTLLAAWDLAVSSHGSAPAIYCGETTQSFAAVDEQASAIAVALQSLDVGPGNRVGILLQNDPEWYVALLATWKVDGVVVPLNPMYGTRELEHVLNDSGVCVVVCESESVESVLEVSDALVVVVGRAVDQANTRVFAWADLLIEYVGGRPGPVDADASSVAMLTYTSGTTGPSKGAMNLHSNLVCSADNYIQQFRLGSDDRVLVVAPLFHVTGSVAGLGVGILGMLPVVLMNRFIATKAVDAIEKWRPTFTVGTTTTFIALASASEGRDLSSLVKVGSGGAPLGATVIRRVRDATGMHLRGVFGLTETTGPTHIVPPEAVSPTDPITGIPAVGMSLPMVETQIIDLVTGIRSPDGETGEIHVAGPMVVPGYWADPKATEEALSDGWLRTGDVGFVDHKGWLYVVDRMKDLINASGFKVWPREVEDVLQEHPSVEQAAVVGVPDEYRGETVKAFVVLQRGASTDAEELTEHCRARLASYKYPRLIEFVDALPRNANGKVLRRTLRSG